MFLVTTYRTSFMMERHTAGRFTPFSTMDFTLLQYQERKDVPMIQFKSEHGEISISSAVFSNITGMAPSPEGRDPLEKTRKKGSEIY